MLAWLFLASIVFNYWLVDTLRLKIETYEGENMPFELAALLLSLVTNYLVIFDGILHINRYKFSNQYFLYALQLLNSFLFFYLIFLFFTLLSLRDSSID